MTEQEAFDTAAKGLLAQGEKSVVLASSGVMLCRYLGPEGQKCALGFLIPEEEYSPSLEGLSPDNMKRRSILPTCLEGLSLAFLNALQEVHDIGIPTEWRSLLRNLAEDFGLSPAVLESQP